MMFIYVSCAIILIYLLIHAFPLLWTIASELTLTSTSYIFNKPNTVKIQHSIKEWYPFPNKDSSNLLLDLTLYSLTNSEWDVVSKHLYKSVDEYGDIRKYHIWVTYRDYTDTYKISANPFKDVEISRKTDCTLFKCIEYHINKQFESTSSEYENLINGEMSKIEK